MGYGQYLWWRIRIQSVQDAAKTPRLCNLEFRPSPGWPTIAAENEAISDTGFYDANSNRAIDSDLSSVWQSSKGPPDAWIGARVWGGPCNIEEIHIRAANDANFGGAPKTFWVEGTNDLDAAGGWVRLAFITAGTWVQNGTQTWRVFGVDPADTANVTRVAADVGYSIAPRARLTSLTAEALTKPAGVKMRFSQVSAQVLLQQVVNQTVSGATVPVAAAILSGAATGAATATSTPVELVTHLGDPVTHDGQQVTTPLPMVAGYSVVDPNAVQATGSIVAATFSIIPGAAAGTSTVVTANGGTVVVTHALIDGAASVVEGGDAAASGGVLPIVHTLLPGIVSGDQNLGQTLTVTTSVAFAGNGRGDANVAGAVLPATFTLIPGGMGADAFAAGDRVTMVYDLAGGAATGERNADIPGQTLTVYPTLISGIARTTVNLDGQLLQTTVSFVAGAAAVGSAARGALLPITTSVIAGQPVVDAQGGDALLTVTTGLPHVFYGGVSGDAVTPSDAPEMSYSVVLEGAATGTAVAPGSALVVQHEFTFGGVHADQVAYGVDLGYTISIEPGVGMFFIGTPGDVMVVPREFRAMVVPPEPDRFMVVASEPKTMVVAPEFKQMRVERRFKGEA